MAFQGRLIEHRPPAAGRRAGSKRWWLAFAGVAAAQAVWAVTPTVLHDFPLDYSNSYFYGQAAQGGDGRIFFATAQSLYLRCGELLALTPSNGKVKRVALSRTALGCQPSENLSVDAAGTVWGSLATRGPNKRGSLFRIASGGGASLSYAYTKANGYAGSYAPQPQTDGSLLKLRSYTPQDLSGNGQIDRHTAPGFAPVLQRVFNSADPVYSLVDINAPGDGFTYGLGINRSAGGSSFVRLDAAWSQTELAELLPYGVGPGRLVYNAADGTYIISMNSGGPSDQGQVLKLGRSGGVTVLHAFNGADGSRPIASPIPASDGWWYGTTATGGAAGQGAIYRLRADGSAFETIFSFDGGSLGGAPRPGLLQASDGYLYGRNVNGGVFGQGVIFRFAPGP
jgi:uncharacterized repeat protein (TIGR03803 family)